VDDVAVSWRADDVGGERDDVDVGLRHPGPRLGWGDLTDYLMGVTTLVAVPWYS
jgi:hypothetical protein